MDVIKSNPALASLKYGVADRLSFVYCVVFSRRSHYSA